MHVLLRSRVLVYTSLLGTALAAAERPVTFHKDVLPILQHRCQSCHLSRSSHEKMVFERKRSVFPLSTSVCCDCGACHICRDLCVGNRSGNGCFFHI